MNEEAKRYAVPPEIVRLWNRHTAALEMREVYAKLPFCYERALKSATDAIAAESLFWKNLRALYPEFDGKTLNYDEANWEVFASETGTEPTTSTAK